MARGPTLPILMRLQQIQHEMEHLRREHAELGARLAALEGEFFLLKAELLRQRRSETTASDAAGEGPHFASGRQRTADAERPPKG